MRLFGGLLRQYDFGFQPGFGPFEGGLHHAVRPAPRRPKFTRTGMLPLPTSLPKVALPVATTSVVSIQPGFGLMLAAGGLDGRLDRRIFLQRDCGIARSRSRRWPAGCRSTP